MFKLSKDFLDKYVNKQPNWGPLGYPTFKRTYARTKEDGTTEEFFDTVKRVVEGCYNIQYKHCEYFRLPWNAWKAQKSAQKMFDKMWNFKFLPPGRGLWLMGTPVVDKIGSAGLNNCFAKETKVITKNGIKEIGDLEGTTQTILTKGGKWVDAPFKEYGFQELYKVVLSRQGIKKTIRVTGNHRWFATSRKKQYRDLGYLDVTTNELEKGMILQSVFGQGLKNTRPSPFGIAHGISFGDGTSNHLYLCGEKDAELEKFFPLSEKTFDENKCSGGAIRVSNLPRFFKKTPDLSEDKSYLFGWLAGYFAADGSCDKNGQCRISSTKKENLQFVREVASVIGVGCYDIREEKRISNLTNKESTLYTVTLMRDTLVEDFFILSKHKENFKNNPSEKKTNWKVESVQNLKILEKVYCAEVADYNAFTLDGNILTGNCGFVSTKGFKDYPARPFKFLMDMSMLGVGVGFDVLGAGELEIKGTNKETINFEIQDTRESWVDSLEALLNHYLLDTPKPVFNYDKIRPAGLPIKGFGGTSSGPGPLKDLHKNIDSLLKKQSGKPITSEHIVDIMNMIGVCVVAGNVRRTAEIALGPINDESYIDLKLDLTKLESHRWASNNSVFAEKGMDYSKIVTRVVKNGEPGFIWLDNIKTYGRMKDGKNFKDYRAAGTNPCVTGDTKLLTKDGFKAIESLVDQKIEIWNGFEWSEVSPKITGENQQILKIIFSDGRELKCTPYHKFHLAVGYKGETRVVEAKDLKLSDNLIKHELPIIEKGNECNPVELYTQGFYSADGVKDRNLIWLYEPKYELESKMDLTQIGKEYVNKVEVKRKAFKMNFTPKDKSYIPFDLNLKGRLAWLAGLFDGDGTELKEGGIQLASIDKKFLTNLQYLLVTCGVNSKIVKGGGSSYRELPDQKGSTKKYLCKETNRICISAASVQHLKSLGMHCNRLTLNKTPNRDASRFTTVVGIEELGVENFVYCFTEPKRNLGLFDGVITGQCGEQTLESFELCCLVETFPSLHESKEEFIETLKYAYLYAKSVTLVNTHWPETNAVMLRNRRIGTSQTGIIQAFEKHGRREMLSGFCDEGYAAIQQIDKVYSDWLCIPRSIKTTTVKPSGTVSLLPGVTPGIHYPHSEYYIRRIRFDKNDPILNELKNAGYKNEPCVYSKTSQVVEFPVKENNFYKGKKDTTVWEQLENAAQYQHYWSDNQVSITVDVTDKDFSDIATALELYESRLKSVSFLPYNDHGYKQAPYEEIDKKTYEKMCKNLKPYDLSKIKKAGFGTNFCDGDACEVPDKDE